MSILPYCRKCGTKLEENAQFCYKCGTPIAPLYAPSPPPPPQPHIPLRKDPVVVAAAILAALLLVGVFVAALLIAPIATIDIEQTFQDNTAGVKSLILNFQSNIAEVEIFTQKISSYNFLIALDGTASKGLFSGDAGNPVQLSMYNNTQNNALTVNAILEESTGFSRLNIHCKIYVNPELDLKLNVTSKAGQVTLTGDSDSVFQYLNLQSSAGEVQANLQNSTISGNVTLQTQAGTVNLRMNQANLVGNSSMTLQTNAGSVSMDITETKTQKGNLQIDALTDLGSINLGLTIDNGIAARITSTTNLGSIQTSQENFSGNQSSIESNNYPAASNIEINNKTNLGSININANYQSSEIPITKN